jgi:hypothetical protein
MGWDSKPPAFSQGKLGVGAPGGAKSGASTLADASVSVDASSGVADTDADELAAALAAIAKKLPAGLRLELIRLLVSDPGARQGVQAANTHFEHARSAPQNPQNSLNRGMLGK